MIYKKACPVCCISACCTSQRVGKRSLYLHIVFRKKEDTIFLPVTLSNIVQFSKKFYLPTQQQIWSKVISKEATKPRTRVDIIVWLG